MISYKILESTIIESAFMEKLFLNEKLFICWRVVYFDLNIINSVYAYIDGLMQDCNISSALAMAILQSCTNPSIYDVLT